MNCARFLGALAIATFSLAAAAQYPAKPVKILVAFTAGGTTDIMARTVAQRLSEKFGAFVKSEFEKWRTVVRGSGAVVD